MTCTEDAKKLTFCSFLPPAIECHSTIWDTHTSKIINQVVTAQDEQLYFPKMIKLTSSDTAMLNSTNWEPLDHRRKITRIATCINVHQRYLPIHIKNIPYPVQRSAKRSHSKITLPLMVVRHPGMQDTKEGASLMSVQCQFLYGYHV